MNVCHIGSGNITNKNPFIGLFNHPKIFGPGLIIKKLAGGQKLTRTLEHIVGPLHDQPFPPER
jgi:hypothetical protein